MLPGGYSARHRQAENVHVKHIKAAHMEERMDMLARNKKLQHETTKRRRALAMKRKTELQREEQRRQQILTQRREQIRQATEKYQRLNHNYEPKNYDDHSQSRFASAIAHGPNLEDALKAVRGTTPQHTYCHSGMGQYNANRRGSDKISVQSPAYRQTPAGSVHSNGSSSDVTASASNTRIVNTNNNASSRPQGHIGGAGDGGQRARDPVREKASRNQLHSHSLRNMSNSRSLFEQQLENQQRLLVEQQKKDLLQFNAAIQSEIDKEMEEETIPAESQVNDLPQKPASSVYRSDSLSSVDSLDVPCQTGQTTGSELIRDETSGMEPVWRVGESEGVREEAVSLQSKASSASSQSGVFKAHTSDQNTKSPGMMLHLAHTTGMDGSGNGSPSNGGFVFHHSFSASSPNVAIVQPSVMQQSPSNPASSTHNVKSSSILHSHSAPHINVSDMKLEDAGSYVDPPAKPRRTIDNSSPSNTEVITTNSNGRYNGQFYQDSVLHHTVQGENNSNQRAGYDQSAHPVHPGKTRAWPSPVCDQPDSGKATPHTMSVSTSPPSTPYASSIKPQSTRTTATYITSSHIETPPSQTAPVMAASNLYQALQNTSLTHTDSKPTPAPPSTTAQQQPPPARIPRGLDNHSWQVVVASSEDDSMSSEASSDESDVASESRPEPQVKSILKKGSSMPNRPAVRARSAIPLRMGVPGKALHPTSRSAGVRDSLEVTKEHIKKPKKKSVRFAEEDEYEPDEPVTAKPPRPTASANVADAHEASGKSPLTRPQSSKPVTTPSGSGGKKPRASSAGSLRRGPFLRPHPPSQPPSGRATMSHNHQYINQYRVQRARHTSPVTPAPPPVSSAPPPVNCVTSALPTAPPPVNVISNVSLPSSTGISMSVTTPGAEVASTHSDSNPTINAMYDPNGLRLDRTPTDDEINWLWENVRNCLARENTKEQVTTPQPQESRQAAVVSQKFIDGDTLAPSCRASTRVSNNYTNNYMGSNYASRNKKITVDTLNSMNRKNSLLHHRQQHGAIVYPTGTEHHTSTTHSTIQDLYQQASLHSHVESTTATHTAPSAVSASLAGFLVAEKLSEGSVTESQMERAVVEAQHQQQVHDAAHNTPKVPTALSIEEQRLMQSLEKLNERLRVVDGRQTGGASIAPRPPAYDSATTGTTTTITSSKQYGAFKGRTPIQASSSRRVVNSNGTVARHRISSAPTMRVAERGGGSQFNAS